MLKLNIFDAFYETHQILNTDAKRLRAQKREKQSDHTTSVYSYERLRQLLRHTGISGEVEWNAGTNN